MKTIVILIALCCMVSSVYAASDNLYEQYKGMPEIKVYLKEVTNDTNDPHVNIKAFEKVFKDSLSKRINMNFVSVDNPKEAAVMVTAKIKKYAFTEKAKPSMFGAAAFVADTATPKSAAKLVVDYKIISPTNDKVLLEYKNFTTDERRPQADMLDANAFVNAAIKNINRFIYRAFYKKRKRM